MHCSMLGSPQLSANADSLMSKLTWRLLQESYEAKSLPYQVPLAFACHVCIISNPIISARSSRKGLLVYKHSGLEA